jgi:hypothetical protein
MTMPLSADKRGTQRRPRRTGQRRAATRERAIDRLLSAVGEVAGGGEEIMRDDRRVLVQVSLRHKEQLLLRRLAAAAGLEPAVFAHKVLLEELRRRQKAYGGVDALPPRDDSGHGPWYAEGPFRHLAG